MHADDALSYYSSKFVQVRNWRIGLTYYIQVTCVFIYIIVYLVCYKGQHLQPNPIQGSANLRIQHPTKHCNPLKPHCKADWTPLTKLPYCKEFLATVATIGVEKAQRPEKCVVQDNINISFRGHSPGVLFVPTRVSHFDQKKSCEPSEENGYWCENVYTFEKDFKETSYFVADSERFTVLVDHSFQSVNQVTGALLEHGEAADYRGKIEAEPVDPKHPFETIGHDERWKGKAKIKRKLMKPSIADPEAIPGVKEQRLKDFPGVFMISIGDVLAIGDLLKLADPRGKDLLDWKAKDGKTIRWQGAVIIINIEYGNHEMWDPLAKSPVGYTLSATILRSSEYKKMHGKATENGRVITDTHGFLMIAKVHGRIHTFEFQGLLAVITTSITLLAIANLVTDYTMIYLLKFAPQYGILKYQKSQRFSNLNEIVQRLEQRSGGDQDVTAQYSRLSEDPHMAHEKILSDSINCRGSNSDSRRRPPAGEELLYVIAKMEERLNRIDGMGAKDIYTSSSEFLTAYVDDFETNHWKTQHGIEVQLSSSLGPERLEAALSARTSSP